MKVEDSALVLASLQGDMAAFGELYDRYGRLVRAICNDHTRDQTRAQDLAQEVFLRVYVKLGRLKDTNRFGPWLISITRNVCREYRRGRSRDRHVLVGLEPPETQQSQKVNSDDSLLDLQEAMARLSERERLALHAFYLQGQDVAQAQKVLGISRSGFYRLLQKARRKLEKSLEITPKSESDNSEAQSKK